MAWCSSNAAFFDHEGPRTTWSDPVCKNCVALSNHSSKYPSASFSAPRDAEGGNPNIRPRKSAQGGHGKRRIDRSWEPIIDEARIPIVITDEPDGGDIAKWRIDGRREVAAAPSPLGARERGFRKRAPLGDHRFVRHDLDGSAHGSSTVERSLRSAQRVRPVQRESV